MTGNINRRRHTLRPLLYSFIGDAAHIKDMPKDEIQKIIKNIDDQFNLILMTEYFDLGLALLSVELCWPTKYLAYLRVNEGFKVRKLNEQKITLIKCFRLMWRRKITTKN